MISKVSWLLSLAIIYSCFYRLGEAHITMKSCLGVWILFCCKIILSKNVKSAKPQSVTFEPKRVRSLVLKDLIQAEGTSPFPALTQIEAFGTEVK